MLQLTRNSQSGEVVIGLRSGERFFSPVLFLALTLALALHLAPLLLFRLQPREGATAISLAPTLVLAHPQMPRSTPLAAARQPAAPIAPLPHLPEAPPVPSPITISTPCATGAFGGPTTEASFTPPTLSDLFTTAYRPVTLTCEGDLAALPITSSPPMPPERTISPRIPLHHYTLRYRVKVEGPSGNVLWVRPETTTGIAAIDNRAHAFIRHLTFTPTHELFIAAGVVEITVQSPEPWWPT